MFKRGFKAVNEEKVRLEEQKSRGTGLFRFFLSNDKDEADITFLTEQPVNYYEHTIKNFVMGKERYESIPCKGDGCPHCADGDRPSFKSAWLIIDHREVSYTDKEGNRKSSSDNLRLLVYGTKVASQLDRKSERYGLTGRMYTVVRLGKGTSTTYTFEHGDKYTLTDKEIEAVMPDYIKALYDGTSESLYKIIESEISKLLGDDVKEDKPSSIDETLASGDEEEEKPVRRSLPTRRKVENRTKRSIKELLRNR